MLRFRLLAAPLAAAAALAGCADPAADPATAPRGVPAPPPVPAAAPAASVSDAARGGPAGFYWLTPTAATQPATFPGAFDAAAVARLAVEVCALAADGATCDGAPVARYTATTTPYAQQLRADAVRQHVLVYWNTAAGGVAAGRTYRARVLASGGAGGDVALGWTDVRVVATGAELALVDRARAAGVVLGQQLTLRFRVEAGALPAESPASVPADSVRRLAARVYDALDARRDATREVTDALSLVMDVLPTTAAAPDVESYWRAGAPVATDLNAQVVARAMRDTLRVAVDNFAGAAGQRGAFVRATGAPLTPAALTAVLAPLVGRASYARAELLPALVLALGEVRADRAARRGVGGPRDAVWGDRALDALQSTLLLYAVEMLGPTAPAAAPAAALRADRAPGAARAEKKKGEEAVDYMAGQIGIPKDKEEGAKTSICGAVLMHSYRFAVEGAPLQLGTDNIGLPTRSDVAATLVFDFTPNYFGRIVLNKAECEIPENGPAAGKGILWRVPEELRAHGRLTASTDATDAAGRTTATYATYEEAVPVGLRGVAKEDNGTITARAFGLMPQWPALEFAVGAGVYNFTEAGPRVFVKYYEWPAQLQLDFTTAYASYAGQPYKAHAGVTGSITLDREVTNGTVWYSGFGPSRYTHWAVDGFRAQGCTWTAGATGSGEFGFVFVARSATPFLGSMRGGPVQGTEPVAFERLRQVCGEQTTQLDLHMFNLMMSSVYQAAPGGGVLPMFVRNSLGDWQTVQQGTIRAEASRTVGTGILADPVVEQSTFTLRAR